MHSLSLVGFCQKGKGSSFCFSSLHWPKCPHTASGHLFGEYHTDFQTLTPTHRCVQYFFLLTAYTWKTRQKEIIAWYVKWLLQILGLFFSIQNYTIEVCLGDGTVSGGEEMVETGCMQQANGNILYVLSSHSRALSKVQKPYVFPILWLNEVSISSAYVHCQKSTNKQEDFFCLDALNLMN